MNNTNNESLNHIFGAMYSRLSKSIEDKEVFRVLEWYETISETYDELYCNEQRLKYFMLLKDIELHSNSISKELLTIVDIGCGTAELASYMDDRLGSHKQIFFVGLDLSPKQLNIAKKKSAGLNIIVELIAADLTYPPLREGINADVVTVISVIKCWYDVHAILDYMRRSFSGSILLYTILCNDKELLDNTMSELSSKANCKKYSLRETLCIEGSTNEGVQ